MKLLASAASALTGCGDVKDALYEPELRHYMENYKNDLVSKHPEKATNVPSKARWGTECMGDAEATACVNQGPLRTLTDSTGLNKMIPGISALPQFLDPIEAAANILTVNPDKWGRLLDNQKKKIIYHEMGHSVQGLQDQYDNKDEMMYGYESGRKGDITLDDQRERDEFINKNWAEMVRKLIEEGK